MIVQKEFISKLKDFGLNTYESKLWTALLSRGISTAGELSDIANVPRSRAYDVLESLERKGFIIMKIGKPIKYIAVPPSEVLERVKKRIREDAERHNNLLSELEGSEVLSELNQLHSQGVELIEPSDLSGSVKGRESLYDHMDMMLKTAEESVIIMTTESGLMRKLEVLRNTIKRATQRGVQIKIVSPPTDLTKIDKTLSELCEIRQTEDIKARFAIVDGKEVLFMLLSDEEIHPSYDVGVWVNTELFASALKNMFDLAWEQMKPIPKQVKN